LLFRDRENEEKPNNYRTLEIVIGKRNFLAEQRKAFRVERASRSLKAGVGVDVT
jgi:hypothetical protein